MESVGSTKRYAGGWQPIQYKGKSILTIRAAADALLTKEEEEKEREQEKMTSLKRKSPAGDVEPQTVDKKKKV